MLSISDAVCTDLGIRFNLIDEANPLVKLMYETSIWLFYGCKIFFPLLLLIYYPTFNPTRRVKAVIATVTLVYILVNLYHLLWIAIAVFYL
ncbi:DUF5658 family protein [Ammoniphilus oxalaticus]|uniref:DUF5658 family protein n=1 Tax=Ammoniphilus oxalaticus TaxID=66863 RepID=UPI003CCC4BB8